MARPPKKKTSAKAASAAHKVLTDPRSSVAAREAAAEALRPRRRRG